jgi:hypothetical protein
MISLYLNNINNNISLLPLAYLLTITKKHSFPGNRETPTDLKSFCNNLQLALINKLQQAFKELYKLKRDYSGQSGMLILNILYCAINPNLRQSTVKNIFLFILHNSDRIHLV